MKDYILKKWKFLIKMMDYKDWMKDKESQHLYIKKTKKINLNILKLILRTNLNIVFQF